MFKRVLVPLDGSMLAESALESALHLARHSAGTVYLMRVPVYVDSGEQTSTEYHRVWTADNVIPEYEDTTAYLRDVRDRLTQPGVSVRIIVGEGERAEAIVNTASTRNIDLVVMASHARSGVSRWLLGSVAGKVIRQAQSPVMLVRQPSDFKHILITLDGSELAERVVESALALAAGFGSQITFLQVEDESDTDSRQVTATAEDADKPATGGGTYLEGIMARYASRGLEMKAITVPRPVAGSILSYAAQNDVGLIAMSTNGRSGLRRLIFGSVTEKVMCDSGCAMLIVRPNSTESAGQ